MEDEHKIASMISDYLMQYDYDTHVVRDFKQVEQEYLRYKPQLVIMDVSLPWQDGFHLCRSLRRHSKVPIIFLSARAGELEQVLGIESGGDDYLTKPFSLDVLHAKIKAILRRTYGEYAQEHQERVFLEVGSMQLDLGKAEIWANGESQSLTKNGLRLMCTLMENQIKW